MPIPNFGGLRCGQLEQRLIPSRQLSMSLVETGVTGVGLIFCAGCCLTAYFAWRGSDTFRAFTAGALDLFL